MSGWLTAAAAAAAQLLRWQLNDDGGADDAGIVYFIWRGGRQAAGMRSRVNEQGMQLASQVRPGCSRSWL